MPHTKNHKKATAEGIVSFIGESNLLTRVYHKPFERLLPWLSTPQREARDDTRRVGSDLRIPIRRG